MSKTPRIVISEFVDLSGFDLDGFQVDYDPELFTNIDELLRRLRDADALIIRNRTQLPRRLLEAIKGIAPNLKVIGRLGAGLDNIAVGVSRDLGIDVVYAPDANTSAVVEYCIAQMLIQLRKLAEAATSTRSGEWARERFLGRELCDITMGVVGLGRVGLRLADLIQFMGAKVLVNVRHSGSVPERHETASLTRLMEESDVISINVSLNESTNQLISRRLLSLCKPNVILLNTSRGEIINEDDLYIFLANNPNAHAVLDVRNHEPPNDLRFSALANVSLTPHIAAFSRAAQRNVTKSVLFDVKAVLSGEEPRCRAPAD